MNPSSLTIRIDDDDVERYLESAKRVLQLESEGLDALSAALDRPFVAALDVLAQVTGHVIVTGMGKSGHVARKIAATLASTGAPAMFVHPAEASHGDLGMIRTSDAVVALSNSGETSELADMVAYTKRFEIPLIAMTSDEDSALAKAATVPLILPKSLEACPMGLAPTTSTTMMIALGDAIAVALLKLKGFSSDDFHVLHPGGQLGRRLLKVSDIMHTGDAIPLVDEDTPMADALLVMTAKSFGCVGIMDSGGHLLGVVTDGDLRRHMSGDLLSRRTSEVMTEGFTAIREDALASEAVRLMNARAITNLFVMEGDRPLGILHIHDCLRAGVA
jgi:arabinose-5-phosphate isomerase